MQKENLHKAIIEAHINYRYKVGSIPSSMMLLMEVGRASKLDIGLSNQLKDLDSRLTKYSMNHIDYFASLLFISLISAFEAFLVDILKAVIVTYPTKVGSTQFKLTEIINLTKDELILSAVEDYLNKIMYKRPLEYLSDISNILSIDSSLLEKQWLVYIEAKARRDLGVHNSWKINEVYIRKIVEVGLAPPSDSQAILNPDAEYLLKTIYACSDLLELIFKQIEEKFCL